MKGEFLKGDLRLLLDRPTLKKVFGALEGVEARVVGGAVRNALLGERIADVDLAVAAAPEVIIEKAERAGLRAVPTGIEHGTVTLVLDGAHFEVTSLREDVETDGRRAKVRFGGDFAADAQRRDFTINALSVDAQGTIYDYVGGLDDLARRRVRFIGDPRQRIAEDFLRILRFFRFSAVYGDGPLDPQGFAACVALREGIERLSRERLGGEMLKTLSFPRSAAVIETMSQAGLLAFLHVAPWPARCRHLAAIFSARNQSDPLLGLAALALHSADDAARLSDALRLSRAQKRRLAEIAEIAAAWHGAVEAPAPAQLREALFLRGAAVARDALLLIQAESRAEPDDPGFLAAEAFLRDTPAPRAPFAAVDLLARGVRQGAGLGAALKRLQADWIRAGFPQDPHRVAALIDAACARRPHDSALRESGWTRPRR
jgi:poly(A) polymerase